jgi:hypothetical protein
MAAFKEVAALDADLEVTPVLLEVIVAIATVCAGMQATFAIPRAPIDALPAVVTAVRG